MFLSYLNFHLFHTWCILASLLRLRKMREPNHKSKSRTFSPFIPFPLSTWISESSPPSLIPRVTFFVCSSFTNAEVVRCFFTPPYFLICCPPRMPLAVRLFFFSDGKVTISRRCGSSAFISSSLGPVPPSVFLVSIPVIFRKVLGMFYFPRPVPLIVHQRFSFLLI